MTTLITPNNIPKYDPPIYYYLNMMIKTACLFSVTIHWVFNLVILIAKGTILINIFRNADDPRARVMFIESFHTTSTKRPITLVWGVKLGLCPSYKKVLKLKRPMQHPKFEPN